MATQLNPIKITGKADNALQGIHFDGDIVHRWSLERVEADTLTYKATCVRFSDTRGEVACRGNHGGVCRHAIEAFRKAMQLAGFTLSPFGNPIDLTNGNYKIRFAVQRSQFNDPLSNLQELIDAKRLALEPGKTMPIGYKVQLRRMERDGRDVLVFENGTRRSGPMARLGRDYQSRNVRHQWKMTADAERNYREFCG